MSSIWYSIILVGIFTFLTRLSFILLSDKIKIQPNVQRSLRFVPIAVLSAIILPELVQINAIQNLDYLPRIFAGIFAIISAWRTRSVLFTIILGMITLYFLSYVVNL